MISNKLMNLTKKLSISIGYGLLNIYLGAIMLVVSHQIYVGPRFHETIGSWMCGAAFGIGFMMIGSQIVLFRSEKKYLSQLLPNSSTTCADLNAQNFKGKKGNENI